MVKIRCLNLYGTVEQPSVDTSSSNVIFKIVSKENMTGNSAAVNMTLLDFYSTWIAKEGTTPRLRIFTGDIDRNSGTAGAIWSGRTATGYASGNGTKEDPYIIETAEQLALLVRTSVYDPQQTADKYYKLANNIFLNDTSADEWYTSETANEWFVDFGYDSIGFQGNFNGNGYSVYGICYKNTESNKSHGLFPALGGSAVVENVAVSNFYSPDSTHWAGAIAGFISPFANTEKPIEIRSCVSASSNRVGGKCAGGILGHDCKPIVLSDCLSAASVEPLQSRGTLIGNIDSPQKTSVTNCLSLNTGKTISFWSRSYPFTDVTNVYSTQSSINVSGISIGSITGEKAKATLKGFDFENTWAAVDGGTPVPKVFINRDCDIWNGDMADSFAGGDGTESNPYIIKTGGQLYKAIYAGRVNGKNVTSQKYYRLENDIYLNDVSDTNWYTKAGLNEWVKYDADKEIGSFRGTLDGNGYTVYGIYYSKESYLQYTGLIPHASEWGDGEYTVTVKNIGIKDSYINGINAGAIVGIASGNNNNKVLVSGCYADESVILNGINAEGSWGSSGLAAMVDNPNFTMEDCFSRVKRVGYTKSDEARGSLIGWVNVDISTSFDNAKRVLVKNCYAVITKEDYDRGFSVVPENWAGLNVHYVNVRWLEEAVKNENEYAEYLLGKTLLLGEDVEQDSERAEELLKKSADKGNKYAKYILGKSYIEGILLLQNKKEGLRLVTESANEGFTGAEYYLGKLLYKGEIVNQDIKNALYYLESAAEKESEYAAYLAGKIRLNEQGFKDIKKAIKLFEIAAKNGNSYAEYQLGKLYVSGKEIEKDYNIGMEYLKSSAEKGNQYAEQLIHSIENNRDWSASIGIINLLYHLSRTIRDKTNDNKGNHIGIDRKLKRKIDEKKQAQGLKL